jgi:hypothetical protein
MTYDGTTHPGGGEVLKDLIYGTEYPHKSNTPTHATKFYGIHEKCNALEGALRSLALSIFPVCVVELYICV